MLHRQQSRHEGATMPLPQAHALHGSAGGSGGGAGVGACVSGWGDGGGWGGSLGGGDGTGWYSPGGLPGCWSCSAASRAPALIRKNVTPTRSLIV